jgi:hypothetical protein
MPKAKSQTPSKPLDQLSALLEATTNDELLELIVRAMEAGVDRLGNYARVADAAPPPVDVLNEGIVFGHRLRELVPLGLLTASARVKKLSVRMREHQEWLQEDLEELSGVAKGRA